MNNLYKAQSRQKMSEYKGLMIALDDNFTVKASMSDNTRKFVESVVTDPKNQGDAFFTTRYMGKDGKVDFNKFASEMQLLDEWPQISRKIFQQGLKRGEKATISRELRQESSEAKPKGSNGVRGGANDWAKRASSVIENAF